jgi:hypothetical protein
VSGGAVVRIDAAPVFAYTAKGKHNPGNDTTNLELRSAAPDVKTSLALRKAVLELMSASSGFLNFKIAGQKGKVELPGAKPLSLCIRGSFCDVNEDTSALFTGGH